MVLYEKRPCSSSFDMLVEVKVMSLTNFVMSIYKGVEIQFYNVSVQFHFG